MAAPNATPPASLLDSRAPRLTSVRRRLQMDGALEAPTDRNVARNQKVSQSVDFYEGHLRLVGNHEVAMNTITNITEELTEERRSNTTLTNANANLTAEAARDQALIASLQTQLAQSQAQAAAVKRAAIDVIDEHYPEGRSKRQQVRNINRL